MGSMHECAGIAICLLGAQIQLDPHDSTALNEFVGTCSCYVTHLTMQFHDQHRFNKIGPIKHVYNFLQVPLGPRDAANLLSLRRYKIKVACPNVGVLPFLIECYD